MKKFIILFAFVLTASFASAQPVATSDQSLAWNYSDQDVADFMVNNFQIRYDSGEIIDAGMKRLGTTESYFDPLPSLTTGDHVANVRACRATDNCSVWGEDFNFTISVFPAPTGMRIVDTPEP